MILRTYIDMSENSKKWDERHKNKSMVITHNGIGSRVKIENVDENEKLQVTTTNIVLLLKFGLN